MRNVSATTHEPKRNAGNNPPCALYMMCEQILHVIDCMYSMMIYYVKYLSVTFNFNVIRNEG